MEVQKQYNLRIKKNSDNTTNKNTNQPPKNTYDSDPKKTTEKSSKKSDETTGNQPSEVPAKQTGDFVSKPTQIDLPSTSEKSLLKSKESFHIHNIPNTIKVPSSFNLESELAKIKKKITFL